MQLIYILTALSVMIVAKKFMVCWSFDFILILLFAPIL